jgi:hypothetical protein
VNIEGLQQYMMSADPFPEKYWHHRTWAFPVLAGERLLRTIYVSERDGEWGFSSATSISGNAVDPWIVSLQDRYPPDEGFSIAQLFCRGLGAYVLLYEGGELSKVAPVIVYRDSEFAVPEPGEYLFVPIDEASEKLKSMAVNLIERNETPRRKEE